MICIIDYKLGNIRSLVKAFNSMNGNVIVSNKYSDIKESSKLVLPGVGSFKKGMEHLRDYDLVSVLKEEVLIGNKPFLGICLGMQLLFKNSEEDGLVEGLGFIDGEIRKFDFNSGADFKIPHMGWNNIFGGKFDSIEIFKGIEESANFYFVHSYHALLGEVLDCVYTDYGYNFVSAIQKDNIYGTQFHPEKSQKEGLKIIKNFIQLKMSDNA